MASPASQPQIPEATRPACFVNRFELTRHVVKHLIDGHDERWHQIVDAELLSAARKEHRQDAPGPAFQKICKTYEQFVSDRLLEACAGGKGHLHQCRYWVDLNNLTEHIAAFVIDGWAAAEKMIFSAESRVTKGHCGPYHLLTARRPWPNLSPAATARKAEERYRHRRTAALYRLLAVHDS